MIHSTNHTQENEDYWYVNERYDVDSGRQYPCEEIYFIKNTEIPLGTTRVVRREYSSVQIWLTSPPHRIHGNDTVIIEWQPDHTAECQDAVTWKPERLYFNSMNFEIRQELVITRVKNGGKQRLIPVLHGGGYETVTANVYPICIK
ncbi:unnamed protein product [Rotaria sp. Silwood2]|nr:unnamed protein product [Rotaria sp. Silwood2]CAF3015963.1 unnamed protein product [Rotaria sp. Silwood2]CAF3323282.1 unnamed protein product [Rotaria sp. Silwood2]CAF3374301.1 unnamed protein product [Rotaria sp. Silwood2]CAF4096854.1 unnamed protein product [Rotaria sp. Silwood2]